MTPRRSQSETIEHVLKEHFPHSEHEVFKHGRAALRLERVEGGVVIGWLSTMTVVDFLQKLDTKREDLELTISRPLPEAPRVSPERLLDPGGLTSHEVDAVYLVRADLSDAAIVWERAGDGVSDVAVASDSPLRAEQYLSRFVPPQERGSIADQVTEFLAS